jgi:hypothetical protein
MRRFRRIRIVTMRYERDLVAIAGVGCLAIGLATISIALGWIVVGAFLLFASGSGRRRTR